MSNQAFIVPGLSVEGDTLQIPYGATDGRPEGQEGLFWGDASKGIGQLYIGGAWRDVGQLSLSDEVLADTTATNNSRIPVNTTANAVKVTLPSDSPSGTQISIFDSGWLWEDNNVTVTSDAKINGSDEDLILDTNGSSITLISMGDSKGWYQIGASSGGGLGGCILLPVTEDTVLETGYGALVDTLTAETSVTITLPQDPAGGDEVVVGDIGASAYTYNIEIIPHPDSEEDITIEGADSLTINSDNCRLILGYVEESKIWRIVASFGGNNSPKAIYNKYTVYPDVGDDTFTVNYSIGYVDVLLNGAELADPDITATSGTQIILNKPVTKENSVLVIKAYRLIDKIEDATYTRKTWGGTTSEGDTVLEADGLESDVAKAYRLTVGKVLYTPDKDYTVSSTTGEVLLTEAVDGEYDWFLMAEAQVQLFEGIDSEIDATNTNNSLTGTTVKENIDELDGKHEALAEIIGTNLFYNGDLEIDQREEDTTYTENMFLVDRWQVFYTESDGALSDNTYTKDYESVGDLYCKTLGLSGYIDDGSGSEALMCGQAIDKPYRFYGRTITMSFDVKGSEAGTAGVGLFHYFYEEDGGETSAQHELDVTTEWTRVSFTWSLDDLSVGRTLSDEDYALFTILKQVGDSHSRWDEVDYAGTLSIANLKLEYGSKNTEFLPEDWSTNYERCRRFYWGSARTSLYRYRSAEAYKIVTVPHAMRSIPSIDIVASYNTSSVTPTASALVRHIQFTTTDGSTGGNSYVQYTLDCEFIG